MVRKLLLLASLALIVVSVPTAPAQVGVAEKNLIIEAENVPKILNPEVLNNGRLSPGVEVLVEFSFRVIVPSAQYCFQPIEVIYDVARAEPYAIVHLSRASESRQLQNPQLSNLPITGTSSLEMRGWTTVLSITTYHDAPGFKHGVYGVSAFAHAGPPGVTDHCSLLESHKSSIYRSITNDYVASLNSLVLSESPRSFVVRTTNLGNYPSRVTYEWGTTDGTWVRPWERILDSKIYAGPDARDTEELTFYERSAPRHWDHSLRVTIRADAVGHPSLMTDFVILRVNPHDGAD